VLIALGKSIYYPLMMNYTKIYANTSRCTENIYDSAYLNYYGSTAPGIYSYVNQSQVVPYQMFNNITSIGHGNYSVVYKVRTVNPAFDNQAVLTISMNASAQILIKTPVLSGIYQGSNYSNLFSGYRKALSIGGPCGILAVH